MSLRCQLDTPFATSAGQLCAKPGVAEPIATARKSKSAQADAKPGNTEIAIMGNERSFVVGAA